jgi:hypothetical protein
VRVSQHTKLRGGRVGLCGTRRNPGRGEFAHQGTESRHVAQRRVGRIDFELLESIVAAIGGAAKRSNRRRRIAPTRGALCSQDVRNSAIRVVMCGVH